MAGHPVNYASICIARPNTGEVGILFELRGAKGLVRGLSLDLVFDQISAAQFRSYTKRAFDAVYSNRGAPPAREARFNMIAYQQLYTYK